MLKINYVGQIIGTRKIIKNNCDANDWIKNGLKIPKDISSYKLCQCLNCGHEMPCDIKVLKRYPPKKCSYCSGIGYKGTNTLKRNFYEIHENYVSVNVLFKDEYITFFVDIEDFDKVKKYVWRISKKKNKYYAVTGNKKTGLLYVHNYVLNYTYNYLDKKEVDHIDGNSLNNRKSNLRIVSRLENIQNVSARIDNKIGIRGIVKTKSNKYQVDFSFNDNRFHFRYFDTIQEAVFCRKFAEEYFGLQILDKNPLAQQFLTLNKEKQENIKEYTISRINN